MGARGWTGSDVTPGSGSGGGNAGATMNLERVSNEEKLELCRKYYLGGFLLLPFLWLVNVVWFSREAFLAPPFGEQPRIKRYVIRSAVGAALWGLGLGVWVGLFQTRRNQWGALGDALSFTQPMGEP